MQKKILIIGVHAPAQGDNPKFFTDDVFPILGKVDFDHSVLGGDWNLGMEPSMDYFGYTNADLDRFPASLESEAGERTLSKVGF